MREAIRGLEVGLPVGVVAPCTVEINLHGARFERGEPEQE
jgi:hypothetical protein